MKTYKYILTVLVIALVMLPSILSAKKPSSSAIPVQTVSGSVVDKETREDLGGVYLYFKELQKGVFSGPDGQFNLVGIAPGKYNVTVKFISYHDKQVSVNVEKAKKSYTKILLEPVQP